MAHLGMGVAEPPLKELSSQAGSSAALFGREAVPARGLRRGSAAIEIEPEHKYLSRLKLQGLGSIHPG